MCWFLRPLYIPQFDWILDHGLVEVWMCWTFGNSCLLGRFHLCISKVRAYFDVLTELILGQAFLLCVFAKLKGKNSIPFTKLKTQNSRSFPKTQCTGGFSIRFLEKKPLCGKFSLQNLKVMLKAVTFWCKKHFFVVKNQYLPQKSCHLHIET